MLPARTLTQAALWHCGCRCGCSLPSGTSPPAVGMRDIYLIMFEHKQASLQWLRRPSLMCCTVACSTGAHRAQKLQ
eukprot:1157685-Pelagomonas_calceolata.AAC.3